MIRIYHHKKLCFTRRFAVSVVLLTFLSGSFLPPASAGAQDIFLPAPGSMVALSPAFNPPILKGIKVYPENPFIFDFILDNGEQNSDAKQTSTLVKYFLASLTTPEKDMWVNLSPYEKDRIVPESFGQTEMGRDLLAQDYLLKQITASLMYPEDELGKKFWERVRAEAQKKFGTTDIPLNTFNKVWIVPSKAVVYENPQSASAYIVDAKLKVMLEEDYVAMSVIASAEGTKQSHPEQIASPFAKSRNDIGSQIIREIVIPALTKEVNEGKNFAQLRQVYNSLILAAWYKRKIKDSILSQVYIDKNKVIGVEYSSSVIASATPSVIANAEGTKQSIPNGIASSVLEAHLRNDTEAIYQQYLEAFKKGTYNYIKEEFDPLTQEITPRKYFSGGFSATKLDMGVLNVTMNRDAINGSSPIGKGEILQIKLASSANVKKLEESAASSTVSQTVLPGGAKLMTQISSWQLTVMKESPTEFYVAKHRGELILMKPYAGSNGQWQHIDAPLAKLDSVLGVSAVVQSIYEHRIDKKDPLIILDWGVGNGTGIIELHKNLKAKGIPHHIYGLSHDWFPEWEQAPAEITFILDDAMNLGDYFADQSVDFVFSRLGLAHLLSGKNFSRVQFGNAGEHLGFLMDHLLKEDGILRIEGLDPKHAGDPETWGDVYRNREQATAILKYAGRFKQHHLPNGIDYQEYRRPVASSPIDEEREELLASAEGRFEKPYSQLVQKPERTLNENVAEKISAVEIQMEIDRLIPELDIIIFGNENPARQTPQELREHESEFLQRLRSLYMDIRVPVYDELEFIGISKILKDLRASRNKIYYAIEKADRAKDVAALKELNQQAIRSNRLVLKAQLLLAGKMFNDRLNLKNPSFIYYAVRETLRGALNSSQMLEEELGYRIGRLQAAGMVREIETSDWMGNIVRTFRLSGFDIKIAPASTEGQEPAVTVRQQHWINVHTRLDQTLTDIRQGRIVAAQAQLDLLRDVYQVDASHIYAPYNEISEALKAIRAKTSGLVQGQALRRSSAEAKAIADVIEEVKALVEVPKLRVWMDVSFEEGMVSAFRGYLHRFAGYIQEIRTVSRNKTTLEFFVSKLKIAEKSQYLSQRNLEIILAGIAPIVKWASGGFVYEKQRVEIKLEPAVEKIKAGDYEGAQADILLATAQLQGRLNGIERIVGHSKRQAASLFAEFRDKDITNRTDEIRALLEKNQFVEGFRELNMLMELYFNQDQIEPGYVRAAASLQKAAGKIRAMQRSANPVYLIKQTQSLLRLAQQDVKHKYSLKVYALVNGKRRFSYISPGTTLLGYLRAKKLDLKTIQVSIGKGWLDFDELRREKLTEERTITINTASSALSDDSERKIRDNVDYLIRILELTRNRSFNAGQDNYEYGFYVEREGDEDSLPQSFRRLLQNVTGKEEIKGLAVVLNEEWKERKFDKDFGSLFEYVADIFSDYLGTPSEIKQGYDWFYSFLEAATPLERTLALRMLVVSFSNHLRSGGLHPETDRTVKGFGAGSYPMDHELIFGNDRDLKGPQILHRYVLSLLELQKTPQWQEVIKSENGELNPLSLTYEDVFLWTLILLVDPTVSTSWTFDNTDQELQDYISGYFGEPIAKEKIGIKFLERGFNHESVRGRQAEIEDLLQRAFSITEAQWAQKGQKSPYRFALMFDNLKSILAHSSFWETKTLRLLDNPMLMIGFDASYFPESMNFLLKPGNGGKKHRILKDQGELGLRPLYEEAYSSPEMAVVFPKITETIRNKPAASSAFDTAAKGGIDFVGENLNLETRTSGGEIKFEMDPQQLLELQNAPGFTPVIINIQPMINLRIFLGLKDDAATPLALSKVE